MMVQSLTFARTGEVKSSYRGAAELLEGRIEFVHGVDPMAATLIFLNRKVKIRGIKIR